MRFTVQEIADKINGEVVGNRNDIITDISNLENSSTGDITFANDKYIKHIKTSKATCIILTKKFDDISPNQIIVKDPYTAFIKVIKLFENFKKKLPETGIHPNAILDKNILLGENISIGPLCYIGKNTNIGDNTIIYPQVYIGENVQIGSNVIIYPNVSIREAAFIGNNVIIHCGAVIGSDGYAYRQEDNKHNKIPQIGTVRIEDDVEIGANTTIDRSTVGATIIGKGTKIDNLVHVAHNNTLGENILLVAQVGIAGSCKIGNGVVFGGQVGVKDHVNIGDYSSIGAQSGVIGDLPPKSVVWGTPARNLKDVLKTQALENKLPELIKKIKKLETKLDLINEK